MMVMVILIIRIRGLQKMWMNKIFLMVIVFAFVFLFNASAVELLQPLVQVAPSSSLPAQHLGYSCFLRSGANWGFGGGNYWDFPLPFGLQTFAPGSAFAVIDSNDPNYGAVVSALGSSTPTILDTCEDNPANPLVPEIITVGCSNYYANFDSNIPANYVGLLKWNADEVSNGQGILWECQQWYQPSAGTNLYGSAQRQGAFFTPKLGGITRISNTNPGPAIGLVGNGGFGCGGSSSGASCNIPIQIVPQPGTFIQTVFLQGPAPSTVYNPNQVFGPCPLNQACSFYFVIPIASTPFNPATFPPNTAQRVTWFITAVDSNNVVSTYAMTL